MVYWAMSNYNSICHKYIHYFRISHQPLRRLLLRIRSPLPTREAVIRLTVDADFFMDLAISVWVLLGLFSITLSTANSSKVQFKVSI